MTSSKLLRICAASVLVCISQAAPASEMFPRPCVPKVDPPPKPVPVVGVTYPICFYDTELGAVENAKEAWPGYAKKLEAVLLGRVQRKRATIVSSRAAVVWAPHYTHRRLQAVWPEIACVGRSGGSVTAGERRRCISYVRAAIAANLNQKPLPASVQEPACQTFLSKS